MVSRWVIFKVPELNNRALYFKTGANHNPQKKKKHGLERQRRKHRKRYLEEEEKRLHVTDAEKTKNYILLRCKSAKF